MALHRFPSAVCRDAHLLVVVARRPAACEGVAEPEAALESAISLAMSENGRRAFVRSHHEIGIVSIPANGTLGRRRFRLQAQIVSDAKAALGRRSCRQAMPSAWTASRRGLLASAWDEAAFGAYGTMTTFFTCCALTRPKISVRKSSAGPTSGCRRARLARSADACLRSAANKRKSRRTVWARGANRSRCSSV